jgi:hypothetical protein
LKICYAQGVIPIIGNKKIAGEKIHLLLERASFKGEGRFYKYPIPAIPLFEYKY